jgi:hypothetical protein
VPLIVELGAPADSMRAVLERHGVTAAGTSGPEGLDVLSVYSVPAVLMVDPHGVIAGISNPGVNGSWPPVPDC